MTSARLSERGRAGELMDYLVRHKAKVHYGQVRPMHSRTIHTEAQLRRRVRSRAGITLDCSESVTLICKLAGMRDPNGLNYNGTGYTGTMLGYLDHYSDPAKADIGALVVFGGGTGEHVVMVRHPNPEPGAMVVFSHGTEADPDYFTLGQMIAGFPGVPWTFLSVAKLITHR